MTIDNDTVRDTVRADLAIAEATARARAGDLAAARRQLSDVDSVAGLDLLARVHAQSGDLDAARACWSRVRAAEPDHPGAEAGLRTIAAIRAHRRLARPLARPSRVAVAAAVVVAGAVAAGVVLLPPAAPARATTAQDTLALRESRRADQLLHQLAASASASAAANTQRHNTIAAITDRLTEPPIPGLLVHGSSDTVEIMFGEGLFVSGERLTATGRQRLRELGTRLAGLPGSITVVGQTVAVPDGPASGGSTVAMSRAIAAAQQLASASGLPLTAFTLASGDQADPPFVDPAQDRTVIVQVRVP
ncbi:MAG TPA: hypothetical protein VG247_21245 [Pseudonocardiaceae bacterium]|nr:hypothetical protein [Pseudonocardiaceae bacterium]